MKLALETALWSLKKRLREVSALLQCLLVPENHVVRQNCKVPTRPVGPRARLVSEGPAWCLGGAKRYVGPPFWAFGGGPLAPPCDRLWKPSSSYFECLSLFCGERDDFFIY